MPKTVSQTKKAPATEYPVRGNEFTGRVTSAKTPKMVTVLREIVVYIPKFERYKKVRSKVHAHNPETINAKENDIVKIGETRKISKTKAFIVTEIVGHTRANVTHEDTVEGTKKPVAVKHEKASEETA
jgi:small subunit ribosomal protein S17